MKANKKTLMAVKRYLEEQEGWDLDEIINEMVYDTKLLKSEDTLISPDECSIFWGDQDNICDFEEFINAYSNKFIENICNVLDSFVGDDIDCYFEDEE